MTQRNVSLPFAVAAKEFNEFGCPYCGYRSMHSPVSCGGASICICGECKLTFVALADGIEESPIGLGLGSGMYYPKLEDHPRRGTPSHGRLDKPPEEGGEYFSSRGIGLDHTPGCFICGGGSGLYQNIAAFVQCREAGERVVAMFRQGAYLDYREYEPDYLQVKVGACDAHASNLAKLSSLTIENKGVIAERLLLQAMNFEPNDT
jgi:hypothetical protein